jgi:hypothetical protein
VAAVNLDNVFEALAYNKSPVAYVVIPVPPYVGPIAVAFHVPVVIVPTLTKLLNVVTAVLTNVPVVGNVTLVAPVVVNVKLLAPLVVNAPAVLILPPRVIV